MVLEAGCRKKKWIKNENTGLEDRYEWQAGGSLLANGACIDERYEKHLVPEPGKTRVYSVINREKIRHVDSRKETISVDLVLTMRWFDPKIHTNANETKDTNSGLVLSPGAMRKIWTPDIAILNVTSFKIQEEWTSLRTSKIIPSNESEVNVEMTYGIKASVYCTFDHSKHPLDVQKCNMTLGSRSFGAIFVLASENDKHRGNETYSASNFHVSSQLFDDKINFGNNTIGIAVTLNHFIRPFVIKYYLPSMAIVVVSLLGFAFPLSAIPGRVALLVTQFLTLTNLFIYEMVCKIYLVLKTQ